MKTRLVLAVAFSLTLLLAAVIPAWAAGPVVTNDRYSLESYLYNPCAGESVFLTGEVHELYVVGDQTFTWQRNLASVSGVGQTTGDQYIYVGANSLHETLDFDAIPYVRTSHTQARLISVGSGVEWTLDILSHLTINANGIVTSDHSVYSGGCS